MCLKSHKGRGGIAGLHRHSLGAAVARQDHQSWHSYTHTCLNRAAEPQWHREPLKNAWIGKE